MKLPFNTIFKSFWKGEGAFAPKSMPFMVSSPYSNMGASDRAHFSWVTKPDLKKHLELLYDDYASKHPFIPSALALKNPAKRLLEEKMYAEKAKQYCMTNERTTFSEMLYKGHYGLNADKKPRQGSHLSSSWVRGLRVVSPSRVQLKLGGKWYTYESNKSQQQRLMQLQSIGAEINKAKKNQSSVLTRIG